MVVVFYFLDKSDDKTVWTAIMSASRWYLLARLVLSLAIEFFPFDPLYRTRVCSKIWKISQMINFLRRQRAHRAFGSGKVFGLGSSLALRLLFWFLDSLFFTSGI
jgi:hypothetical protein